MKRICLLISVVILTAELPAQINKYGTYLLKNYDTQVMGGSDFTHSIIRDHQGIMYFANEDNGILRYDGSTWRSIPVRNNGLIRAMSVDSEGTIYAGGKFEFGYLEPDSYGRMVYRSVSERIDEQNEIVAGDSSRINSYLGKAEEINIGEILSIVIADSSTYFVSKGAAIFRYTAQNDSLVFLNPRQFGLTSIVKAFAAGNRIIVGDNRRGLYELKNDSLIKMPGGEFFIGMQCYSILPYDSLHVVASTLTNGVYLYNFVTGEVERSFCSPAVNRKLSESVVYNGTNLPFGEMAFGTVYGGVFVLDRSGNLVQHLDNDNSDLPGVGIWSIYSSSGTESELWIATSKFITKAYVNLPISEFSMRAGLDGSVNSICLFNGDIYVATDMGVFKSQVNEKGERYFRNILPEATYPLVSVRIDNQDYLMAGTIMGIFKIGKDLKAEQLSGTRYDSKKNAVFDLNVRSILQSRARPGRFYFGSDGRGVYIIDFQNGRWHQPKGYPDIQGTITAIEETGKGDLLINCDYRTTLFYAPVNDSVAKPFGADKGLEDAFVTSITRLGNDMVFITNKGLFRYDEEKDLFEQYNTITGSYSANKEVIEVLRDHDDHIWISLKDDRRYADMLFTGTSTSMKSYFGPLAMLPNVKPMDIREIDDRIWIAKSNNVYVVTKERLFTGKPVMTPLITKIQVGRRDSVFMEEQFFTTLPSGRNVISADAGSKKMPEFRYNLNSISFYWSLPQYVAEDETRYSYKLDGFDKVWSKWDKIHYKDFTNLPFGKYTFRVRAKTATEYESSESVFEFYILKPWYFTTVMIILYVISILLIIFGIIKAYTRKLKNENIRLEGIVAERTAVVVKQKEELESSIHYASRIQMALLPSESILSENLRNYFILFKPRDIVSGDFYWMTKKENRLYIVAADCTGHGVPGAFMSLLGMSFLDEIIDKEKAPRADHILSELRLHVTESLKQSGMDDEAKDGMDMALLVIDFNVSKVEFSGAYNPCFRVRQMSGDELMRYTENNMEMPDGSMANGKYILETVTASKMPIGISSRMNEKFVLYEWDLEKGVSYYLFSDGYIDQFGGSHGRKFMKKNFKRLLLEIQDYPMKRQKEILDQNLLEWMGQSPQIDDILVMGIRTD